LGDALRVMPGRLAGTVQAPPSKSLAHRALLCAWLAGDIDCVRGVDATTSRDIAATIGCLAVLGTVRSSDRPEPVVLDCGESGTTLRLLVPVVAALGRTATFTGEGRLPSRPVGEYLTMLSGRGATLSPPPSGSLPLGVRGQLLPGGFHVPGGVSSQYVSGMLLALPVLPGDSTLRIDGRLESAPYVDLTLQVMRAFGVQATKQEEPTTFHVPGGQTYRAPERYLVEGDYSQAAFWLVADHLGSQVAVTGLAPDSAQGDRAIESLLARLSAAGGTEGAATDEAERGGIVVDGSQVPDLVPVLAVAAVACARDVRIVNASRLRLKESDRLASTADALTRIGADVTVTEDGLRIRGRGQRRGEPLFEGGEADAWNDHRIAMALAIAALRSEKGVVIHGWRCVEKSYPDFFEQLERLGGEIHGIHHR
jgi:3-phosphoshikimate 1-carboxyvinyltransferase